MNRKPSILWFSWLTPLPSADDAHELSRSIPIGHWSLFSLLFEWISLTGKWKHHRRPVPFMIESKKDSRPKFYISSILAFLPSESVPRAATTTRAVSPLTWIRFNSTDIPEDKPERRQARSLRQEERCQVWKPSPGNKRERKPGLNAL